jgi:TPP-dependent pyruvate/acetoin dehydrogenase alpha subunit
MAARTKKQGGAAATAGDHGFSIISNEKLVRLYTTMVKCRMIGERVCTLLEQSKSTGSGEIAGGREAAAVGVAIDLLPEDTVVAEDRDFAVNFIQGVPLESIFRSLLAHAGLPNLAAWLDSATAAALANKMKKNGKVAVAFSSDGSGSLNSWHEALTRARVQQLPVLFVSHTTSPAELESPNGKTGVEEIGLKAQARGLPEITVDGNDVVAVYRVATEAIAHARRGNGPTLIECQVERSEEHDPILRMETYLARKGLFSAKLKLEPAVGFTRELDAAIEAAAFPEGPESLQNAGFRRAFEP